MFQLWQRGSWNGEACPRPHNHREKMLINFGTQSSRRHLKTGPSNIMSDQRKVAARTHLVIFSNKSYKSLCDCLNWKHRFLLRRVQSNQGQFPFHWGQGCGPTSFFSKFDILFFVESVKMASKTSVWSRSWICVWSWRWPFRRVVKGIKRSPKMTEVITPKNWFMGTLRILTCRQRNI
jgi:hypothetical protein